MLNIALEHASCNFPYNYNEWYWSFQAWKGPKGTYNRHNRSYHIASEDMKYGTVVWTSFMILYGAFGHFRAWQPKSPFTLVILKEIFFKNPPFVFHKRKSYRFGVTWGWVNNDRTYIFCWTIPVDASTGLPAACVGLMVAGCVCVWEPSFTFLKQKHNLSTYESLYFFTHHIVLLLAFFSPPLYRTVGEVIKSVCPLCNSESLNCVFF